MRAVGYRRAGPVDAPDALVEFDAPVPQLRPRDLLVRVAAVSVNPADVKLRAETAPFSPDQPRILGFDAAGIVEAVGPDVELFAVGDAVFYAGAIDRQGCNAELHAVDERLVGPKPVSLGVAEAAALPLTALTAWELLFERLRVPPGDRPSGDAILIVNGAGGVGSMLTQMARRLTGLVVIATASRPETRAWVVEMGAHHVIDHHRPLEEGLAAIGLPTVRYVAGLTATDRHRDSIVTVLEPGGALAMIDDPAGFDVVPFKQKSLSVHWELMFTRGLFQTADMAEQHRILREVSDLCDKGVLRTTLRRELGPVCAANLIGAHAAVEAGRGYGKIVLCGF